MAAPLHQTQRLHRRCRPCEHDNHDNRHSFHVSSASRMVQSLNNRASVLVSIGNLGKARHLYEVALAKHMQMACEKNGPYSMSEQSMIEENDTMDMDDDFGYDTNDNFEHSEFLFHLNGDTTHQGLLQDHPRRNTSIASSKRVPFQKTGLWRMSNSSRLKTASYSGQGVNRCSKQWVHHQVYSLPIVMENYEWERAPIEVRSFVLIFNSALCSHLKGMELLSQGSNNDSHRYSFEVAKSLYELALKAFSDAHSMQSSEILLLGVDRLCCPSVFNNLSHIYKTLDGPNSNEARHYDSLLLKSVYWLISTTRTQQNSSQSSQDESMRSGSTNTSNDNGFSSMRNRDISNSCGGYGDDEAEIIDAFLENVFYLVGAPDSMVPAPAA